VPRMIPPITMTAINAIFFGGRSCSDGFRLIPRWAREVTGE
jgi:hypothetical protein